MSGTNFYITDRMPEWFRSWFVNIVGLFFKWFSFPLSHQQCSWMLTRAVRERARGRLGKLCYWLLRVQCVPIRLSAACLLTGGNTRAATQLQTAVCYARARVLSLSFRIFGAVGSSFGPVWFVPPLPRREVVMVAEKCARWRLENIWINRGKGKKSNNKFNVIMLCY